MKKILGLDLGTGSIGWAVVNEAENPDEKSSIVKIGVRVNPLTADEKQNFEKGKSITTNSDRTLKRSMRRNLQRYKLRRNALMEIMKEQGWITDDTILAEQGNNSTYSTLNLRAKAATEEISLEDLAKVLLMINKKRGYKSSRKVKNEEEEGQAVDSMETARQLHDTGMTPGEFAYRIISEGNFNLPDFYRSDLQDEFDRIWEKQREYYPKILTDSLKEELKDKNEKQTWKICEEPFDIEGIKRTVKGKELIKENYEWRTKALNEMLDMESLAIVLQKINGQIKNAGGYLGNISDRSKELYFNGQTVGQCLAEQIRKDPNTSLKNQVYYRQDHMDEFDRIWETQAAFHPELTPALKKEIKELSSKLEVKTIETIKSLSDDTVKEILKDKWIFPICSAIEKMPDIVLNDFVLKLKKLSKKYNTTYLNIDDEIRKTEKLLSSMIDELEADEFDKKGLEELQKLLRGE